MFAYCRNNPVNHSDPDGDWVVDAIFLAADIAQFIKKPSLGNFGWVLLSMACFVDVTGVGSTAIHALRGAKYSARILSEAKRINKLSGVFKRAKVYKTGYKTSFKDLLSDIKINSSNWKKIDKSVVASTKKGNKGGG